jgi:amino acid adenylation domain-containing protein
MQEGMLFHSLVDEANYLGQTTFTFKGALNLEAIEESMNRLIARHHVLRNAFVHQGHARPLQIVHKSRKVDLAYHDLRKDPSPGNFISDFLPADRSRKLDLSTDHLMRLTIFQTADDVYEFVWTHHHILMDGWCMGIIVDEFKSLYLESARGVKASMPAATPYADYINWICNRGKEQSNTYWQHYLSGYESVITLPQKEQTGQSPYVLKHHTEVLAPGDANRLSDVCKKYHLTMNTIFQCAWGLLLARYCNTNDVLFGSVVSGRPDEVAGIETMVGLFINTIPVRIQFDANRKFSDLMIDFQTSSAEGQPHHYHPLAEIQSLSPLGPNLINHILAFENMPLAKKHSEGGPEDFKMLNKSYTVQTNYDLNVWVFPFEELKIAIDYNGNRFSDRVVVGLVTQLQNILSFIGREPEAITSDISLLDETVASRYRVLYSRDLEVDGIETIQSKLNKSFKAHHDRTAIEHSLGSVSYARLRAMSLKILGQLEAHAVPRGAHVGIMCYDRRNVIASVLGILSHGAVFVPLETSLPATRLSAMIAQADVRYILTENFNQKNIEGVDGTLWINITPAAPGNEATKSDEEYSLDDPIYIYFTSGSTGRPKGVLGLNKGLSHFVSWEIETFSIDSTFRFSQFTNPGFDVFMRDIFVPLCSGGTICIPDENVLSDGRSIANWIDEQKISLIHCVPTLFKLVEKNKCDLAFKELKFILLAGEKILPMELKSWYQHFGERIRLVNIYGPTETTLAKGYYQITVADCDNVSIPLQAIQGSQFMLLDLHGNICPEEVVGEIYLRTPYRTAGYLGSSQTANQGFIVNPYNKNRNDLIYRTGDRARIDDRGLLHIIGRTDFQVKIRGIRVELDDIKQNILGYRNISDAVVVAKTDALGDQFIAAYFTSPVKISSVDLREYLVSVLPTVMIPSYLIQLEKIPVNANGKVDRKALPEPQLLTADQEEVAANEMEHEVALIWAEILQLDPSVISVVKTFFELGGHSIKIFRLINRIQDVFGVKLKLADVFSFNSIRKLSERISYMTVTTDSTIPSTGKKELYRASPAQERMYYQHLLLKESTDYNICIPVRINRPIDIQTIKMVFRKLMDRHEALRTSFILTGEGIFQRINEDVDVDIVVLNAGNFVTELDALRSFIRPFDLELRSLMRCGLYRHPRAGDFLFVDIHHLVADGQSMSLLIRDFSRILNGEDLPPLPVRYVDYAEWLANNSAKINDQRSFWKRRLASVPRIELPTSRMRDAIDVRNVSSTGLTISGDLRDMVRAFTTSSSVSEFTFILSVYYIVLSKMSGGSDITVGTGVLGRTHPLVAEVVGTFVNVLPLRVDVPYELSYMNFLKAVKQCVVDALDNQEVQFNEMASFAETDDPLRNPIFDFYFSFTSQSEEQVSSLFTPIRLEKRIKGEYDFILDAVSSSREIEISFIYRDVFDSDTVGIVKQYFSSVLAGILSDPSRKIGDLNVSTTSEVPLHLAGSVA